jgi:hypothetical protein
MQNTETKCLKIGRAKDCQRRRRDIENATGCSTRILYIIPGKSNWEFLFIKDFLLIENKVSGLNLTSQLLTT